MYCPQCGEKNSEEAEFCAKCGGKINSGSANGLSKDAAREAVKELIKEEVGGFFSMKTVEEIRLSWKKFSLDEKIIASGAAAVFIGFFLPWVEKSFSPEMMNGIEMAKEGTKWFYLFLVLSLSSLVMLFLNRNKIAVRKALSFQWQIVIGTSISFMGLLVIFTAEGFLSYFQGGIGGGWWLMTFGGIAILTGALRAQKYFLRNVTIK